MVPSDRTDMLVAAGIGLVTAVSIFVAIAFRSFRPLPSSPYGPACTQCGYCIIGVSSPRCPECGGDLRISRRELQSKRAMFLLIGAMAGFFIGLILFVVLCFLWW